MGVVKAAAIEAWLGPIADASPLFTGTTRRAPHPSDGGLRARKRGCAQGRYGHCCGHRCGSRWPPVPAPACHATRRGDAWRHMEEHEATPFRCRLFGMSIEDPQLVFSETVASQMRTKHVREAHPGHKLSEVWKRGTTAQEEGRRRMTIKRRADYVARTLQHVRAMGHDLRPWPNWVRRPGARNNGTLDFACT